MRTCNASYEISSIDVISDVSYILRKSAMVVDEIKSPTSWREKSELVLLTRDFELESL